MSASRRTPKSRPKQSCGLSRRAFLAQSGAAALALHSGGNALALHTPARSASPFLLGWAEGRLTSLQFRGDAFLTDYIEPGQRLGDVLVTWRRPGAAWQRVDTSHEGSARKTVLPVRGAGCAAEYRAGDDAGEVVVATVRLQPVGDALRWTIQVRNLSAQPVEIGDLALPLPMHTVFKGDGPPTASVLKHSFISGHGSFLFWMRSNSVGPYLLMTPERDTSLEFWDRTHGHRDAAPVYRAYVHAAAQFESVKQAGGRWRQPLTSAGLPPHGSREYGFRLTWAKDYSDVEDKLVEAGLLDVQVAPGMTVPTDLSTTVAIRSLRGIRSVTAEFPEQTSIEALGRRNRHEFYSVRFARLGENMLTVQEPGGRTTRLEFFATEPIETLIQKRGAFIAKHQHRDASKWYNGLLAEWNMDSKVMLGPDNYDRIKGWRIYEVTCDDPGLSKPAFLASKLAEFPDQAEVSALDAYIEHFVWGGLQRTTEESDSYGIYGILDWKRNRDSPDPGPKGQRHMWRPYDYPHIVVMYWGMYRVARDFPAVQTRLTRDEYLERTFGTAMALFTVPNRIIGWEAYQTGFYNEVVIPAIIDELEAVGEREKAAALRDEWEKKVRFFVAGGPNLFGSEYAFDSTGFESTQAIARYALDHPALSGVTPEQSKTFAKTQMQANLFCRGVVEKAYYLYGSDYRAEGGDSYTLSYMAQMGGWGVLNYSLHDNATPGLAVTDATVRLGYASYLSAWALMNTGTAESGHGYWFPDAANDGGCGGGFEPEAMGTTWLGQPHHRGSWYYSSEEDLGFCGALRSAATIVADDPVFGQVCFGGEMAKAGTELTISPRDGVRRRFSLRGPRSAVDVEVTGARFTPAGSIRVDPDKRMWSFKLEREASSSGGIRVEVKGLPTGKYQVSAAGEESVLNAGTPMTIRFVTQGRDATVRISPLV